MECGRSEDNGCGYGLCMFSAGFVVEQNSLVIRENSVSSGCSSCFLIKALIFSV